MVPDLLIPYVYCVNNFVAQMLRHSGFAATHGLLYITATHLSVLEHWTLAIGQENLGF